MRTQSTTTVFDDEDMDLAGRVYVFEKKPGVFYARVRAPGFVYAHTVVIERSIGRRLAPGEVCDHINGDGLDNRRSNLRVASRSQNSQNRGPQRNNSLGLKGVHAIVKPSGRVVFQAQIKEPGKRLRTIGYFDTPSDAAAAYDAEARRVFGAFAYLNFP